MLQLPIPEFRHRRGRPRAAVEAPPPPAPVTVVGVTLQNGGHNCQWQFSQPMQFPGGGTAAGFKVAGQSVMQLSGGGMDTWYFVLAEAAPSGSSWELTDLGGLLEPISGAPITLPQSGTTTG